MKLQHIGIATEDLEKAIRYHETFFGFHPVTEIVEDPVHKVRVVLLSSSEADISIELIAALADDSPVSGLLKRGIHLYHLCYLVDDLNKALTDARRQNSLIVSKPSPSRLYDGRRIAFIYTPEGYLVEFLEEKRGKMSTASDS